MKTSTLPLSIIVPAWNEADNIPTLVERISLAMNKAGIPYELLLVDDRSTDGTPALAEQLAAEYPIRVFQKRGKRGKAYSLLEGFGYVQNPVICMIDADLQYPPEAIVPMYRKLIAANADVVVTNRIEQKTSFLRQASTKICHLLLARVLFGIDYDTQSGLKLFRRSVLKGMDLKPSAWSFDLEFLIRSLENEHKILSHAIPFSERHSGEAKIKLLSGTYDIVSASLRLRMNSSIRKVRRGYRGSMELARRPLAVLAVLICGAIMAGAATTARPQTSSAMTILGMHVPGTAQDSQPSQTTSSQPAPAVAPTSSSDASSIRQPSSQTAATSQPAAATPSVQSAQPKATSAATAARSNTPATATTSASSRQAAATSPNNRSAGSTGSTQPGKGPNYYAGNALSATKTSRLQNFAIILAVIGGSVLLTGGLALLVRNIYRSFTNRRVSDTVA